VTHEEFIASRVSEALARNQPFVIDAAGWEGRYVQGALTRPDVLLLEAADLDLQGTGQLDSNAVTALEALGFARGAQNFEQHVAFEKIDEAASAAARIGARVFEIYGVDPNSPLCEDGHYSVDWLETRDVRGTPYPPYVETAEQRRRWNLATLAAIAHSAAFETDRPYDSTYVWHAARGMYGDASFVDDATDQDFATALSQARARGLIPRLHEFY